MHPEKTQNKKIIMILMIITTIYFHLFAASHLCLYMHVFVRKKMERDRENGERQRKGSGRERETE